MGEALVEAEQNLAVMYEAKEPIMKELRYMRINLIENKERQGASKGSGNTQ